MKRWRDAPAASTRVVVGIDHAVMAELLGISRDEWLAPAEVPDTDDDDDAIDWEH